MYRIVLQCLDVSPTLGTVTETIFASRLSDHAHRRIWMTPDCIDNHLDSLSRIDLRYTALQLKYKRNYFRQLTRGIASKQTHVGRNRGNLFPCIDIHWLSFVDWWRCCRSSTTYEKKRDFLESVLSRKRERYDPHSPKVNSASVLARILCNSETQKRRLNEMNETEERLSFSRRISNGHSRSGRQVLRVLLF